MAKHIECFPTHDELLKFAIDKMIACKDEWKTTPDVFWPQDWWVAYEAIDGGFDCNFWIDEEGNQLITVYPIVDDETITSFGISFRCEITVEDSPKYSLAQAEISEE